MLGRKIPRQLEEGRHGAEVVGMFFFEDDNYVLVRDNPIGERLKHVAEAQGILLMGRISAATSARSPIGSWTAFP